MARITLTNGLQAGALVAAALLNGCATPPATRQIASIAAPPAAVPKPIPPAGASLTQALPPRDPDGRYRTINSGISQAATIWHVRSALNVAALGCRGEQEAAITANYNALLATKKTLLKTAFAQTEAEARKAGGDWRDAHDREMTQVYNFFAQPPAKAAFCATAAAVAAEAAAVPAQQFQAFAGPALARLEAPFLDFYAAYDTYRRDLAAWEAGDRPTMPETAPATAIAAAPRPAVTLAYASMDDVLAWSPADGPSDRRLASADIARSRR